MINFGPYEMSNVTVGTFAPAQDHSEFAVVFSAVHESVWDVSVEPWASGSNSSLSATSIAAVFLDVEAGLIPDRHRMRLPGRGEI